MILKLKDWPLKKINLLKLRVGKKVKLVKPKLNKERVLITMIVIADIMTVMEEDIIIIMIVDLITEVNMKTEEVETITTRRENIVIMKKNVVNKKTETTKKT